MVEKYKHYDYTNDSRHAKEIGYFCPNTNGYKKLNNVSIKGYILSIDHYFI